MKKKLWHKKKNCRDCGSESVAKILYGLPVQDAKLEEQLQAGQVYLGGCTVSPFSPRWHCTECGYEWGRKNI